MKIGGLKYKTGVGRGLQIWPEHHEEEELGEVIDLEMGI